MKKILQLSFFILFLNVTQIRAQLTANFIAATTQGCAPLDSVQFTDLSTGTPTPNTWSWNFGNGNTSFSQNPQTSYPNPGTYTVTLTVGNGTTTSQLVKTAYITVFQLPVAGFTYTPLQPCVGSAITFYDNTTLGNAAIATWDWGFGDGTTSSVTVDSVIHTYLTPFSPAPVSVIVVDSNGCQDDYLFGVTVNPEPIANFTANPLTGCTVPLNVTFTNTSTAVAGSTYQWNFGDGGTATTTSPVHTYTTGGTYTVTLIVTQGGCKDTIIKPNYITIAPYVVDFTASDFDVCVGEQVTFTETTGANSVGQTWTFGDGGVSFSLSPVHTYTNDSVYKVTLIAANLSGCSDTAIHYITVHAQPVASFVANDTVGCSVPFTVNFTTPAGNTGWSWNFGDGGTSLLQNPSHIYTATGSFTVTLIVTDSHGCKDTLVRPGYINIIPPNAAFNFTPKKGCAPLTVNFTSTSTAIEPFFNYTWNYGDGSPNAVTTVGTATHTYTNPGVYTVSLIVNTINGCKDTLIKVDSVLVGTHVTPSFTISDDTVCYHQPIQFTFNTPGANSWVWFFGDGGIDSIQQNPIHIYGDTGTFTVTLVACNNGCCDTLIVPFMITILPPKAQFWFSGSCVLPYNIICTNISQGADSIVWNFHDGTPLISNTSPITHTFATRGPKTITLYAYNFATGCIDSMVQNHTVVDPIPYFKGVPLSGCYPLIVTFTDTSQDANVRNMFFGDGQNLYTAATTFNHTYDLPGYYDVKLIIYDIHGCSDTLIEPDYIHVYGPLTDFTVNKDTGCAPLSVIFTDSTISFYPVVSYIWNFGDGVIDTVPAGTTIVPHTYVNPGSYTVTLTVFDSQGCSHTLSIPNYIRPTLPISAFSVDTFSCPGKVITFDASASTGLNLSYHWLFGDGGSIVTSSSTTTHTYAANGNYTVTLTVFDQNLCDSTVTHSIHIEKPNAAFTDSIVYNCQYTKVYFTNTSTGTNLTSYYWNFGDGGSASVPSPYNQYTLPGYFSPYLVVTNSAGCTDTIQKDSLVVVYTPSGTFDFNPKEGCKPLEVTFTANAPSVISSYSWNFGDGNLQTTPINTVIHTYTYDITTKPKLILYSYLPDGTQCSLKANVIGDSLIVVNTFGSASIGVNGDTSITTVTVSEGDQTPLSAIVNLGGSGSPVYSWSPSTGLTYTSPDSSTATLSGTATSDYYLYLTVRGQGGCMGLDSILVKVVPCDSYMKVSNVFTPNGDFKNDEFYVEHPCPENFLLTIYNRWGQEVFKTSDPVEKWDGRIGNGEFVPSGTYYWILASRDKSMKGFLQLIRE